MALANYTDLQAAVALWINRTDLTSQIPDFVKLYEADANRRIRIRQNMTTATLTLTAGSATVNLPTKFLEDIELNYTDSSDSLNRASFDDLDNFNTSNSTPARPWMYAITDSAIIFNTEADVTYTLTLRYYKAWDIATDATNWLLTNAPDTYLFGTVAEAAMYLRDDGLLAIAVPRRDAGTDWVLRSDSRTKSSRMKVDPALMAIG
jgi:hypothetical protein